MPDFQVVANNFCKLCLLITLNLIIVGPNNAWIGTVGSVKNMTSHIGIGLLKMSHNVYTVVDFLGPLGGHESRLAQRKPKEIKPYWVCCKYIE